MTAKSIVEVDLRAQEFGKFAELFNRYNEELKKQPQLWQKVAKKHTALATQFERTAQAMRSQDEASERSREDDERRLKELTTTERMWSSIERSSSGLYRNVIGVGTGILKWGSILTGVGAAVATGGLFGFDRLAGGIAGARQTAMGFGVSPAQMQAFSVHLSRFVDPAAFLGHMTTMETDVSQRRAWYALMGSRQMSGNTAQDALSFLNAERQFALRTPLSLLGTQAAAFGLPASVEELMRMRGTGNSEWAQQMSGATRDVHAFGLSSGAALAAQNFTTAMARNRTTMMDQLWVALAGLKGPLTQLSNSLTHAAVKALGSPEVKAGIKNLSDWLKGFSASMETKAFDAKIKTFMADAGVLAGGIHTLADLMGKLGLGNLAVVYGGARAGAAGGSLFGPVGTVVGMVGGAVAGDAGYQVYKHREAIGKVFNYGGWGAYSGWDNTAAPVSKSNGATPAPSPSALTITIQNATGGSAVVAINGLAGH